MFANTEEIAAFVPIQKHISFNTLSPFLNITEDELRALVSEPVFLKLKSQTWEAVWHTEYNVLLNLVKRCLAFGLLVNAFPSLRSQVSELGIQQSYADSADLSRPAPVADAKMLLQSYQKQYYVAADKVLSFMERNTHAFQEWVQSESYTEENRLFVRNTAEYQRFLHQVNSRKLYLALKPYLTNAENLIICQMLGTSLFTDLKLFWQEMIPKSKAEAVSNLNSKYPVNTYMELIEHIKPVMAYRALNEGSVFLAMSIESEGIFILDYQGMENRKANDYRVLEALRQTCGEQFKLYEQRLREFIQDNKDLLPKYPKPEEQAQTRRRSSSNEGFQSGFML